MFYLSHTCQNPFHTNQHRPTASSGTGTRLNPSLCNSLDALVSLCLSLPSLSSSHLDRSTVKPSVSGKPGSVFWRGVSCSSNRAGPSLSMPWHRLQRYTSPASSPHNFGLLVCLRVHPHQRVYAKTRIGETFTSSTNVLK